MVICQIQGVQEPGARWNLLTFLTNTQHAGCSKYPELKESQWSILMRTGALLVYADSRWVCKVLLGIATESWEQRNAQCWCWKLLVSSFTMPPAGTTASFSLIKIRGHNQHRSPTGTRLSGSGQGFPTEMLLWGDCCTHTQLTVGLPAVVAVCVPTASSEIRSGATASYLYRLALS